jgi:hypothetical protein
MAYSIFNRFLFNQPNFKYFWLNLMKKNENIKFAVIVAEVGQRQLQNAV